MSAAGVSRAREILAASRRIISFSGAGLSAESGLSTFRHAPDSLWSKHDPTRLASPEGFADDPQTVMDWYAWRREAVAAARPNAAHQALAQRSDVLHVTQNVDDLLERAGATGVIHLHGTVTRDHCHGGCGHEEPVDMARPPRLRDCPRCGLAQMRPSVVWFGESLPAQAWRSAEQVCSECDALLVVGTSAVVYPAAGLIGCARSSGARIIVINIESSGPGAEADVEILGRAGDVVPRLLR